MPGTLATRLPRRKPRRLPVRWLVTDALRLPDPLPAIRRLGPGDGVLFRHYEFPPPRRLALARQVAALCRRMGLILVVAADIRLARAVGADGLHLPQGLVAHAAAAHRRGLRMVTAAAHDAGAVARAARAGVDAVLVSPVFRTASHPGAVSLGPLRLAALASQGRRIGLAVYAMGGITPSNFGRLGHIPLTGYAAIGGLSIEA